MSYNSWGHNGYPSSTSPKPTPANNPFLETSAANRFPAIDSSSSPTPSASSFLPGFQGQSYGHSPGPSSFPSQQYGGQSLSYNTNLYPQQQWAGGVQSTYTPGGYPQASQPQFTGFSSGYGQPQSPPVIQQQYTQYTGYPHFQQQQQSQFNPPQYQRSLVNEFDPYSNVNALANTGSGSFTAQQTVSSPYPTNQSHQQPQQSYASGRTGPSGQPHPRDFIQSHKPELESWNLATWKQILDIFDELKRAWERRRTDLQRQLLAGQYLTQEDTMAINTVCIYSPICSVNAIISMSLR